MTTVRRLRSPSSHELTSVLLAPAARAEPLRPRLREALAARLAQPAVATIVPARRRRLDAFSVERGATSFSSPFRWNARAARRVLGTAAARGVAEGSATGALGAASDEVDRLCDRATRGLVRPGSLAAWLAGEPRSVHALCAVEAATWAAALLGLVDVRRGVAVGVADAWFDLPGGALTLHGRRDAIGTVAGVSRRAVLRVRDGVPAERSVEGLIVEGLIEALAAPEQPLPARVVGAWPDAGLCLVVEFDDEAARSAARELVALAESLVAPDPCLAAAIVAPAAA